MPQFFDLPRELRDMIYLEVITSQLSLPDISSTQSQSGWCRPWEPKSGLGDHGCAFSSRRAPNTCANFLACNKQVNEEMLYTIERARRKGGLAARMDCIAKDEMHWFTWLSIPLVKTDSSKPSSLSEKTASLVPKIICKYLPTTAHRASTSPTTITTTIEQLQIDIRLFSGKPSRGVETPRDRTSWAICAALKHVFEHDPDIIPTRDCRNDIYVHEVILNLLPQPPSTPCPITQTSANPSATTTSQETPEDATQDAEALAKELVDVWNKLWSGDEFKARYYRNLLERIGKVRVMLEGQMYRVRDVGEELERGKRERRRIEMRGVVGW